MGKWSEAEAALASEAAGATREGASASSTADVGGGGGDDEDDRNEDASEARYGLAPIRITPHRCANAPEIMPPPSFCQQEEPGLSTVVCFQTREFTLCMHAVAFFSVRRRPCLPAMAALYN